jgi:demethylmenaquinone methyltransferase/2-methoxy-6-polyprenyl-1,4-benzoquinol methylase
MSVETLTPYDTNESKRVQIKRAFNTLAHRYDLLNRVLSIGLDPGWRRRALRTFRAAPPARLLDVATGTADFAILAARLLPKATVTGIDLSEAMLDIGRQKVRAAELDARISLMTGDGLALAFPQASFDAVTVAFGIRNFEDIDAGLRELRRVLKPGGRAEILELSEPRTFPLRQLHSLYLRCWVPLIGQLLTGHAREYAYLPASIEQVPQGEAMLARLREAGFSDCRFETYTFGICSCYTGRA